MPLCACMIFLIFHFTQRRSSANTLIKAVTVRFGVSVLHPMFSAVAAWYSSNDFRAVLCVCQCATLTLGNTLDCSLQDTECPVVMDRSAAGKKTRNYVAAINDSDGNRECPASINLIPR
ncbi:hypothetical protein EDB89DRAFT_877082 [Lactarius sanguifluus]|nr:hypothetical protein EDB89DRAFT_877082 [Lactarius sanguifluus]